MATALADAVFELGERNDGDADVSNCVRGEPFEDRRRMFLDEIDADVRVEHQFHQSARPRSCTAG